MIKKITFPIAYPETTKQYLESLPDFEEEPVFTKYGELKNFKVVLAGNYPVAIVSRKYFLVNHKDLFLKILEEANLPSWAYVTEDYRKAFLSLKLGEFELDDSKYWYGLIISNSVDTTLSVSIRGIAYRIVCENGLVDDILLWGKRFYHVNEPKDVINKVLEVVRYFTKNNEKIRESWIKKINALRNVKISYTAAIEIYDKTVGLKSFKQNFLMEIYKCLDNEKKINGWDLYNSLTYVVSNLQRRKVVYKIDVLRKIDRIMSEIIKA